MKVRSMTGRTGQPVVNQYVVEDGDVSYFQSYDTVIVKIIGDLVILDGEYWDYSVTTRKYRSEFLGENTAETRAKIDSGEYRLANLNR